MADSVRATPVSDEILTTISQAHDLQAKIKHLWVVGASSNADQSRMLGNAEGRLLQAIDQLRSLLGSQDGR